MNGRDPEAPGGRRDLPEDTAAAAADGSHRAVTPVVRVLVVEDRSTGEPRFGREADSGGGRAPGTKEAAGYTFTRHLLSEIDSARYELEWAPTYETVREALRCPTYDVCLLDATLGAHHGLELLREAVTGGCRAPIILLTGCSDPQIDVEAIQAGAADYLVRDQTTPLLLERSIRYAIARKRAEQALHESEECFRLVVEGVKDYAIFMLDPDGVVVSWNAGAERIEGYRADEVIGWSFSCFYPEDDVQQGRPVQALQAAAAEGRFQEEGWRIRKDGSRFWAEVVLTALRDETGRLRGFSYVARDITERVHLEEQLRQAQKMEAIGRLAGGVAHDFNNMLGAITGYTDLLLHRADTQSASHGWLQEMMKACERAATLTRQLLVFSRKQVVAPEVLDLCVVVTGMHKMLRRLIGEDVELVTIPDPSVGCVKADPGQIEQILMNLAVNARDAMPQGGKLMIELKNVELDAACARHHPGVRPGPYVQLSVSDTGCGMDAETQSHIFEPFFTTKERGKGTGLGLATVYAIVQQSGGYLEVFSAPGEGTVFQISLPRVAATARGEAAPGFQPQTLPGSETVLLVEDEPLMRGLVREVLRMSGYTVLEALQGDDALRLCVEHEGAIDLLVTDVVMPAMSGRELAERATALRPEMRVLFMSGYTDDAVVRHGVSDAEISFIEKPFTPAELTCKVRQVLGSRPGIYGRVPTFPSGSG